MAWYKILNGYNLIYKYGEFHAEYNHGKELKVPGPENVLFYFHNELEPLPDEFGDLDEASKKLYLEL